MDSEREEEDISRSQWYYPSGVLVGMVSVVLMCFNFAQEEGKVSRAGGLLLGLFPRTSCLGSEISALFVGFSFFFCTCSGQK